MLTTSFRTLMLAATIVWAVASTGCSDDSGGGGQSDTGADVSSDADAGQDTLQDTSQDTGTDTSDVSHDAVADLTEDAVADTADDGDTGADVGADATVDTGDDAVADAGSDASDAGSDASDGGMDVPDDDGGTVEPIIWDDDDYDGAVGHWSSDYAIAGATGDIGARVNALAEDGAGNVYMGGEFSNVGGVEAENIAMWNGSTWEALTDELGSGPGIVVNAIAVGPSDEVCVGGEGGGGGIGLGIGIGGGNAVKCWDGAVWTDLGPALDGSVYALAFIDGELWVGGDFNQIDADPLSEDDPLGPRGLAIWTGDAYVAATDGGLGTAAVGDEFSMSAEPVRAIAVSPDGEPCIGGSFSEIDGVPSTYVACLAESGWVDVSGGLDSTVDVLHSDGTRFFAGGLFGGGIAELGESAWEVFEGGVHEGFVTEVKTITTVGDDVWVGGQFAGAGSGGTAVGVGNVAVFRDGTWQALDGGVAFTVGGVTIAYGVNALLPSGDYVYAGGQYTRAGEIGAINIARWNLTVQGFEVVFDVSKQAFGTGGPVTAFASDADGTAYIGGTFAFIGSAEANNVAARDAGGAWYALGEGLGGGGSASVMALAVTPDGTLYAGGTFTEAGILGADFFSWWNGSSWRAAVDQLDGFVTDLSACANGEVVATGSFTRAGDEVDGLEAPGLAIFDGSAWRTLALAENEAYGGRAVLCADGDIYTEVSVTTVVDTEEVVAWYVYRWDAEGESWSALGPAFGDPNAFRSGPFVNDFEWYDGTLYAGGVFRLIGEADVLAAASWDGEGWTQLGAGLRTQYDFSPAFVADIDVKQNGVFAIGLLGGSGDNEDGSIATPFDHVAWFDAETAEWSGLGPVVAGSFGDYKGLNDLGEALLIHDGTLFVGGPFSQAGGEPALGLGQWVYRPENPTE